MGSLLSSARSLALLMAVIAGLVFLILVVLSFFSLLLGLPLTEIATAVYCLIAAVVNYAAWRELPALERLAADRQFGALRDHLLVWVILGLLFFVLVGLVLLIALVRLYAADTPTVLPAPPPPGPGQALAPPACATCGNPTTWIPEYRRFYCYRCGRYL